MYLKDGKLVKLSERGCYSAPHITAAKMQWIYDHNIHFSSVKSSFTCTIISTRNIIYRLAKHICSVLKMCLRLCLILAQMWSHRRQIFAHLGWRREAAAIYKAAWSRTFLCWKWWKTLRLEWVYSWDFHNGCCCTVARTQNNPLIILS